MKKLMLMSLIAFASVAFFSCKKSSTPATNNNNNNNNGNTALSQWVLDGITYKGTGTDLSSTLLASYDDSDNKVQIDFGSTPTSNRTYTVVSNGNADSLECIIIASKTYSSGYYSTTATGGTVAVTVSVGKVTATFSNIPVTPNFTDFVMLSGTLVEQ